MPRVSCPQCSKSFQVPDHSVGKRARCSACQGSFLIEFSAPEVKPSRESAPVEESGGEDGEPLRREPGRRAIRNRKAPPAQGGFRTVIHRLLAGATGTFSIVLFVLFFLPWVMVSCGSMDVASQSGFEAGIGSLSLDEELQEKVEKMKSATEDLETESRETEDPRSNLPADWPLFLVLLVASAGVWGGISSCFLKDRLGVPKLVHVLGFGSLVCLLLVYLIVGVSIERRLEDSADSEEQSECSSCDGKGREDCRACEGGTDECFHCSGTGESYGGKVCPSCEGRGNLPCSWCEGIGTQTCPVCDGSGTRSASMGKKFASVAEHVSERTGAYVSTIVFAILGFLTSLSRLGVARLESAMRRTLRQLASSEPGERTVSEDG